MFITKAGVPVTSLDGSLNFNSSATVFQNINVSTPDAGATFAQQGNGFAELKSGAAGSPTNTLRDLIFTPILPSTIGGNPTTPFAGFDGFFARGQVDATSASGWDGVVTMTVDFAGGGSQTIDFSAGRRNQDIGAIGFDSLLSPEAKVSSVEMSLDSTGAWNEAKQFTFSVPGVTPIPETRTWLMLIVGFGAMAFVGFRRRARLAI